MYLAIIPSVSGDSWRLSGGVDLGKVMVNCGDRDKSLEPKILLFDLMGEEIDGDGNKDAGPVKEKEESKSCRRWLTGQVLKEGNISEDKDDKDDEEDEDLYDDDDEESVNNGALTANGFILLEDVIGTEDEEDDDVELVVFVISFPLFNSTGDPITTGDLWPVDLPLKYSWSYVLTFRSFCVIQEIKEDNGLVIFSYGNWNSLSLSEFG